MIWRCEIIRHLVPVPALAIPVFAVRHTIMLPSQTFPNGLFGPKNLSPPWGPIASRGVLSPGSGRRMTLEQVFQTAQNLFPGISLEEVWAALRKDIIVGKVSSLIC